MGFGAWPPPPPYQWSAQWWDNNGNMFQIILTFRYSNTTPRPVLGMDYDLDPGCPWNTLQLRKADGAILEQQIPRTTRTGTVTAAQLANVKNVNTVGTNGLVNMDDFFLGGSITVYQT
jgi:hypothetical protein